MVPGGDGITVVGALCRVTLNSGAETCYCFILCSRQREGSLERYH